jgi:hypothetical protein
VGEIPLLVLAFTLTAADGTLTGQGLGSVINQPAPQPMHLELTVTGGTDAFAGATGALVFDAEFDDEEQLLSGTISGAVVVPV